MLLDAVLHIAAGAVQLFVQRLGRHVVGAQRRHHKAWVALVAHALGLADHAAASRPCRERAIGEVLEQAMLFGLPLLQTLELRLQFGGQASVARQAEHKIHPVFLAPIHQVVPGEPAVGAQHDGHFWEALAQLLNDPLNLFEAARSTVYVGASQPGA